MYRRADGNQQPRPKGTGYVASSVELHSGFNTFFKRPEGRGSIKPLSTNKDGESGYYFSPNDLQLLERTPDLAEAGIAALKIEGRMKSASYVGAVVSAYRLVVDAVEQGDEDEIRRSIEIGCEILRNDFARPKTRYFFDRGHSAANIDWLNPDQDGGTGISLGTILKVKGAGGERRALVSPPRGLVPSPRDSVRIHHSGDLGRFSHKLTFAEKGSGAASSGYWISAPEGSVGDHVYLIQTKAMSKRYTPVITNVTAAKGPGRDKAPLVNLLQAQTTRREVTGGKHKKNNETFPEGLYVAVSRPEDLFILQSVRPERVMLFLTEKNAKRLLADNKPLPFKPEEIILILDPWFPQEKASYETGGTAGQIEQLIEKGYLMYMVNNPGHFSLFKSSGKVKLIAGPWLYMFNSWSLSFIASISGVDGFVSPLESNRQNLERTLGVKSRGDNKKGGKKQPGTSLLHSKFFITVFAWPPLFNIRADLSSVCKFNMFADNKDEVFTLDAGFEGSRVYPKRIFSIIDKIKFLTEAGFGRFIIDLSGGVFKKTDYKDLMQAVNEGVPLPNSSRFNWKDGFYSSEEHRG
jgi:putative protease